MLCVIKSRLWSLTKERKIQDEESDNKPYLSSHSRVEWGHQPPTSTCKFGPDFFHWSVKLVFSSCRAVSKTVQTHIVPLMLNTNVSPKPCGFFVKFWWKACKNVFAVVNWLVCIISLAQKAIYNTTEVAFWRVSHLSQILVPSVTSFFLYHGYVVKLFLLTWPLERATPVTKTLVLQWFWVFKTEIDFELFSTPL